MKYLKVNYPERIVKMNLLKKRKTGMRRSKQSSWETIKYQLTSWVKNPYLHLMVVRFCCFGWIFLYYCFPSLILLVLLCHSIIYKDSRKFFPTLKYFYLPIIWLVFLFNYVINIEALFSDDIFTKDNRRFGIYDYSPAFPHLLYQLFTLFYL